MTRPSESPRTVDDLVGVSEPVGDLDGEIVAVGVLVGVAAADGDGDATMGVCDDVPDAATVLLGVPVPAALPLGVATGVVVAVAVSERLTAADLDGV